MSVSFRPLALALAAVTSVIGTACFDGAPGATGAFCYLDSECPGAEVCFADGCGDPGRDIAVEVLPSVQGARYPQDFAVSDLKGTQLLQLYPAPFIVGELKQHSEQSTDGTAPYSGTVTVTATGESRIIPGIVRRYQNTFSSSSTFSLSVGSGVYTVSVTAEDPRLPPLSEPEVPVEPGTQASARFVFPAFSELSTLSGAVVQSAVTETPVDAILEVQAIDPVTQQALSQRVHTGSGAVFQVTIAPNPDPLATVILRVRPKEPTTFIPQKDFVVAAAGSDSLLLDIGAYGTPVEVRGVVVDSSARAVSNATVYMRGTVEGGGTYRSANAITDAQGNFSVKMLPSVSGGSHALWILPPAESGSAIQRTERPVPSNASSHDVGSFQLKDKLMLRGIVYRPSSPDTEPVALAGVRVKAEPIQSVPGSPLPTFGGSAETDSTGQYVLRVDPAMYRLDFLAPSAEGYPRSSRFFKADPAAKTPTGTLEVAPLYLSHGRLAQGEVTIYQAEGSDFAAAPLSSVRFFRQVVVDGKPGAILLGEAVTDSEGKFFVTLPTKSQDLRLLD